MSVDVLTEEPRSIAGSQSPAISTVNSSSAFTCPFTCSTLGEEEEEEGGEVAGSHHHQPSSHFAFLTCPFLFWRSSSKPEKTSRQRDAHSAQIRRAPKTI